MSAEGQDGESRFAQIDWKGQCVRIEHRWVAPERHDRPLVVFLHEGLGSLAMWKDFPRVLCDAAKLRGLVYSRPAYGRSTPRAAGEHWDVDYLHRQAHEVLPAFFAAIAHDTVRDPPWLLGHSDGGSIALLHAARFPSRVAGLLLVAPHVFVEPISVTSIEAVRCAYWKPTCASGSRATMTMSIRRSGGWNRIWLAPPFRAWNIEEASSA